MAKIVIKELGSNRSKTIEISDKLYGKLEREAKLLGVSFETFFQTVLIEALEWYAKKQSQKS